MSNQIVQSNEKIDLRQKCFLCIIDDIDCYQQSFDHFCVMRVKSKIEGFIRGDMGLRKY